MRSASGRTLRRRGLQALTALVLAASVGGGGQGQGDALSLSAGHATARVRAGSGDAVGTRLERATWLGRRYRAATGDAVRVHVSTSYPEPAVVGQRWADHFASLLHGSELALLDAYVVSPDELGLYCGPYALGCYEGNRLWFAGATIDGVTPEEVATHEYGHHVAANRLNPPWVAIDWGPKRWASDADICARSRRSEVFPADYAGNYRLHPGEGFAEVYRVLNEARAGASTYGWPVVDLAFFPGASALRAAEQDVVVPWTAPMTRTVRARFAADRRTVWETRVSTPLDGMLTVSLRFPRGAFHELTILGPDGRTVLAKGLWTGLAQQRATTTVCGERSVVLRVRRGGPATPFTVHVTRD